MATELSKLFQDALELLKITPLPDDIVQRLDKIREQLPESELELFDDLYDSIE